MAQEAMNEKKSSVKGKMLLLIVVLMLMLIVNVGLGVLLQSKQAEKNVESMLTDNLNGSYALLKKGMGYFGGADALTPENLNVIIADNSCDTMILNSSGSVIASYMKTGTAQSSYKEYVQSPGKSETYPKASGIKGERRVYAAKGIEGSDNLTLLVAAPSSEYYGGLITAFWVGIALVAIMGVLAVITNIFFTKSITKPLGAVRDKIVEMSHGNLSGADVKINTADELGQLASSVNYLAEYTKNIIGDINHTAEEIAKENLCVKPQAKYDADFLPVKRSLEGIVKSMNIVVANIEEAGREVSTSSSQMSANSSMLSQAADEGSAIVKELSSSLNSVHEQINNSAEKADIARNMTEQSVASINEGNKKMTEMLDAMREINATSSQIANIIMTIQDISFQTNILSLNASIEAARAGEAGKGFAVVAGEVGSLAGKTAEAAKSTTGLIETSLKAVEHGMVIANETAEMLGMIVNKANESASVVEEIAHAASQQAMSIEESIDGMNRISASVSQMNTAAHECAASSTTLASQSAMLENTVARFVTDEADMRRAASAAKPIAPAPAAVPQMPKPASVVSAPRPAQKPAAPAPSFTKPAAAPSKSAKPKIDLPDDKPAEAPRKETAPAAPAAKLAPKPAAKKIDLPGDAPKSTTPKADISKPAAKPAAPAAKKIDLPGDKPTAPAAAVKPATKPAAPAAAAKPAPKPVAPAARPVINLPGDDSASVSSGKVVKKATMQPVKHTVRMDPDKY